MVKSTGRSIDIDPWRSSRSCPKDKLLTPLLCLFFLSGLTGRDGIEAPIMAGPLETVDTALARRGLSNSNNRVNIRQGENRFIAVEGENSDAEEAHDSFAVEEEPLKTSAHSNDVVVPLRPTKSDHVVCLRTCYNDDNRFAYAQGGEKDLKLMMGFVDPRVEGMGLFLLTGELCVSRRDFVYTLANLKYSKCIAVQPHPSTCIVFMDRPMCPVGTESDPRVFVLKTTPRPDDFRLESVLCPGFYLTYNEDGVDGDITLSKEGSVFSVNRGLTPVCMAEKDKAYELRNLTENSEERTPESVTIGENSTILN